MQWEKFDLSKAIVQPAGTDQGQPDPARGFTVTFFTSRGPVPKGEKEIFAPHKFEVSTPIGLMCQAFQDLEQRVAMLEGGKPAKAKAPAKKGKAA